MVKILETNFGYLELVFFLPPFLSLSLSFFPAFFLQISFIYLLFGAARGLFHSCSAQAPHYSSCTCCGSWSLERGLSGCDPELCCPTACGVFLDQGSNPWPLPWQAESQNWKTLSFFLQMYNSMKQRTMVKGDVFVTREAGLWNLAPAEWPDKSI